MRNAIIPALLLSALVERAGRRPDDLTPFFGTTFGGETTENRYVYGAVLGFGEGAGVDIDFGYAPNFFGDNDDPFGDLDGKLNITTLMFNIRFGGGKPSGVSPFVSGGAGLMRASISSPGDLFDSRQPERLRPERRRRTERLLQRPRRPARRSPLLPQPAAASSDAASSSTRAMFDLGDFDFWRGTVGVSFRF